MRGFQPGAHIVPKYADGGLVQRALGLLGGRKKQIDEAVKVASQDTRQAGAPAPAPVKTTQDGKFDEKRANKDNPAGIGFANGGMVRGPGTGTSDDIQTEVPEGTYIMPADSTNAVGADTLKSLGKNVPVALSNGEFKIPPEQVHAIGVQALDQIKNATHKPARGFTPRAAPEQPRQFFANGGTVKRLHLADAGVVTQKRLDEEGRVPSAAPAPQAPPATDAQVQGLYQDWQDKKTPWYMPTPKGNRNTPTCVGKTTTATTRPRWKKKHPHVRGEDTNGLGQGDDAGETPPRAWGRRVMAIAAEWRKGNTPTCVGKTNLCPPNWIWPEKHPHVRGEDA